MLRLLKFLWALPISLFGICLLVLVLPSKPKLALLRIGETRALCAWGGWLEVILQKHPFGAMWAAEIGHVVIARDIRKLCYCGAHEFEHVRQTERWGILIPIAYIINGAWQKLHGRHFYRDNCFEVAAYCFGPEKFEPRHRVESWDGVAEKNLVKISSCTVHIIDYFKLKSKLYRYLK